MVWLRRTAKEQILALTLALALTPTLTLTLTPTLTLTLPPTLTPILTLTRPLARSS